MGERHSAGELPGRRRARPGATASAPGQADAPERGDQDPAATGSFEFPGFETRFGAVLRADDVLAGSEAERRAVAAFRAARDAGAHRARTRARDDWRPREPRRARLSLKGTLCVALASLTLGGVAVAAIGSAGSGTADGRDTRRPAHPSASASHGPAADPSPGSAGAGSAAPAAHPGHPDTAQDTLVHCRAYAKAGHRGHALEATAWQRLVTAAGGTDRIAAYCAARTSQATQAAQATETAGAARSPGQDAGKASDAGGSAHRDDGGSGSGKPRPADARADGRK
ncbi:hypothetical protein ABZ079_01760 [Streptomyces sp. NPDC006314]|uniref:hypothetical protein n=1 Tax=Streptomyces sp. NPDC006314 TaxID=3154475 RepID=UPI0033A9649F